jgi:hypothetical protein
VTQRETETDRERETKRPKEMEIDQPKETERDQKTHRENYTGRHRERETKSNKLNYISLSSRARSRLEKLFLLLGLHHCAWCGLGVVWL